MDLGEAACLPSRFRAVRTARDLLGDAARLDDFLALAVSLAACFRVLAEACPGFGGDSLTPARLALESPMAMACLVERAPCLPSRMCSNSSRTNSPACVVGALPSRASFLARSMVFFSGI